MNRKPLRMGKIEAKLPVIQGGMGVGISLGGLAGAVAKEGGIGIISAAQIGFREPDFDRNPREANLRAVKTEYDKARSLAPEGVIGFNIMVAMRGYEEYVRAAIDAGADLIISGAGLPTDLPRIAGESGAKLAPIVSTEKSAQVILKYWDKNTGIKNITGSRIFWSSKGRKPAGIWDFIWARSKNFRKNMTRK